MTRNLLISLEGNIGSGKSTLLSQIAQELSITHTLDPHSSPSITVLPEPVDRWASPLEALGGKSMLQSFYQDGQTNTFAFQMYVLKTRLDQVLDVVEGNTILSERCMHSHDAIFAESARSSGNIDDVQWVAYRGWVDTASRITGESHPMGVIYLRTSPAVCAARIMSRSREAESTLPSKLLLQLHEAHEAFINGLAQRGVPVLTVDGDKDAAIMPESDLRDIVRVIIGFMNGLRAEKREHC